MGDELLSIFRCHLRIDVIVEGIKYYIVGAVEFHSSTQYIYEIHLPGLYLFQVCIIYFLILNKLNSIALLDRNYGAIDCKSRSL
ncbi:hypothetical protein C7B77_25255 [Chamaesiphon polymorphus CCALA 037]|uniref:Uncharacterized protein n=1 Tax=Chamaesiphon polymorphus CCALA 037 TaxID=2107692 RepID=A0A2T1FKC0_9CYAN|nr:hypothetical protein C7B77_25255 [Chamaesiphon polymorphus CCALA 037]